MLNEEMRKRQKPIPVTEIKHKTKESKEMRIRALVPRYEWGLIYHKQGLYDLELELLQFPRSSHDDIVDSLAMIEEIVIYPEKKRNKNDRPNPADAQRYEEWYRNQKARGKDVDRED